MERHEKYLGTYFSKDTILVLTSVAKKVSWVVVGVYTCEWLVQAVAMVLQISRGFWAGMGGTDVVQSIYYLFEQPFRGVVYFVVLQAVAQSLLMFMEIEDNTRRAVNDSK